MKDAVRTTVYLPAALIDQARILKLNVSGVLQDALHHAIQTEIEELHRLVDIGELSQKRLEAIRTLDTLGHKP